MRALYWLRNDLAVFVVIVVAALAAVLAGKTRKKDRQLEAAIIFFLTLVLFSISYC